MALGIVVIGRNEGDRLRRCLRSISGQQFAVVYVDSGSSDNSVNVARQLGADVINLDEELSFTAARARNAGLKRLTELVPSVGYVQFVDGDCELANGWLEGARYFLAQHADVAVVSGRLRERRPEASIYNWLCDQEWNGPVGESRACGGIAMMRVDALVAVGGFRNDLIAGEEPELCVRFRKAGWRIWRLEAEMGFHDVAMLRFGQWWRRTVRSGHAFAEGAYLHGAAPERHWIWESYRAVLWGALLPLICLGTGLFYWPWGWATLLIYPVQAIRQMMRNRGSLRDRSLLALFQVLARFPEAWGIFKFWFNRLLGHRSHLIEHK